MRYADGSLVSLGDIVSVPVPTGRAKARVVMLGETYEHSDIDKKFLKWVKSEEILEETSIVIEWVETNPLQHNDARYAPVGNYMFSPVDEWVIRISEWSGND